MQTPTPKTPPAKNEQDKNAAKPQPEPKGNPQHAKDGKHGKHDPKADPNANKDLPTADHIAAKENAENPPNGETMSDQPGPYMAAEGAGTKMDRNTMSDQPGAFRGKK